MSLPARLCFILIPVLGIFLSSCTLVDHSWNKLEKDTVFYLPEQPAGKKAYRLKSQGEDDPLAGDYIPCTLVPYSRETSPFVHSVFMGFIDIRKMVFCRRDDLPVRTGYVVVDRGRRNTVFSLPRRAKLVKREADEDERIGAHWEYEMPLWEGGKPSYCGYNKLPEFPATGRPKEIVTESFCVYNARNTYTCESPPPSPFACEPASRRVSCPLYDRFINYPLGAVQFVTFPIVWPLHEWQWGFLRSDDK